MNIFIKSSIFAFIGIIVSTLLMFKDPSFTIKKFTFWPSVLLSNFITGMLTCIVIDNL